MVTRLIGYEMKKCRFCRKEKSDTDFYKTSGNTCKPCHNKQVMRSSYLSQYSSGYFRTYKVTRIKDRQEYVANYLKQHPCVDCEETDIIVLEFDHVRGEKLDNVSTMCSKSVSMKKLQEEIAKCEVVCANCHKRRTAKEMGWYKLKLI